MQASPKDIESEAKITDSLIKKIRIKASEM
jgi:hypothetical protein